MQGECEHEVWL